MIKEKIKSIIFDFGGVISKTLFETHDLTEVALKLPPNTLQWKGPFDPDSDPLWKCMQDNKISERDYWKIRTNEVGSLLKKNWTEISDFVRAARGSKPLDIIRPEALQIIDFAVKKNIRLAVLSNELDLFYGERDLNNGEINVLHNLSFIEDPCRLFRSVRFEQRFGFKISKQTEVLMKVAIKKKLVDFLSGTRLLNEIILILKEKHPLRCILRMQELALLQLVSPQMVLSPTDIVALEKIEALVAWTETISLPDEPEIWYVYLLAIFYSLQEDSFSQTIDRLQVPARLKKSLKQDRIACKEGLAHLKNEHHKNADSVHAVDMLRAGLGDNGGGGSDILRLKR